VPVSQYDVYNIVPRSTVGFILSYGLSADSEHGYSGHGNGFESGEDPQQLVVFVTDALAGIS
jgi:hypothetical protein